MKLAPIPKNEEERLEALHKLAILDTKPEGRFDEITKEATRRLKVPISTLTLVDKNREWFKSTQGIDNKEGERAISFCGHALLATNIFVVEDTLKDDRFKDNPMVIGSPYIRFYSGISLIDYKTGLPVGVLCIKDTKPRKLTLPEINILLELASRAEKELNAEVK
jgi:GAF domain-containing protein